MMQVLHQDEKDTAHGLFVWRLMHMACLFLKSAIEEEEEESPGSYGPVARSAVE